MRFGNPCERLGRDLEADAGGEGTDRRQDQPQGWEGVRCFLQAQDWVLSAQLWVPGKSFQVKISHLRWGAGWEEGGRGCWAGAGMRFQAQGVQSLAAFQEGLLPRPPPEWPPGEQPACPAGKLTQLLSCKRDAGVS